MTMKPTLLWAFLFLFTLGAGVSTVHADELTYDRISFTVHAEKEVGNDELSAVLRARETGQDTSALANKVNEAISWAMEQAKKEDSVESRTLGYTTNPNYRSGRIDGWTVQQSIRLTSMDSEALSRLLGVLQEKLQVTNVAYEVSNEVRRKTEQELTSTALTRFRERAEQIQKDLQRSGYRIVKLDINTQGQIRPQPVAMMANARMMSAESAVAPPSLDAGKQNLQIHVNVEIELSGN